WSMNAFFWAAGSLPALIIALVTMNAAAPRRLSGRDCRQCVVVTTLPSCDTTNPLQRLCTTVGLGSTSAPLFLYRRYPSTPTSRRTRAGEARAAARPSSEYGGAASAGVTAIGVVASALSSAAAISRLQMSRLQPRGSDEAGGRRIWISVVGRVFAGSSGFRRR